MSADNQVLDPVAAEDSGGAAVGDDRAPESDIEQFLWTFAVDEVSNGALEAAADGSPFPSQERTQFLNSSPEFEGLGGSASRSTHTPLASQPAQANPRNEMESDTVARTKDLWRVPLSSVERAVPAQPRCPASVVLDTSVPASPLTLNAQEATSKADAVTPGGEFIMSYVTVYGIPLTRESLRTLLPTEWLNDEVLNAYVKLERERHVCRVDSAAGATLVLGSFFYLKLYHKNQYSYENVHRLTRHVDVLAKEKIFIFITVHGNRCVGVLIEPSASLVSLYHSMGDSSIMITEAILRWVRDEMASRGARPPDHPWRAVQQTCRQQWKTSDCGIFTLMVMKYLLSGTPISSLNSSTANYSCGAPGWCSLKALQSFDCLLLLVAGGG